MSPNPSELVRHGSRLLALGRVFTLRARRNLASELAIAANSRRGLPPEPSPDLARGQDFHEQGYGEEHTTHSKCTGQSRQTSAI